MLAAAIGMGLWSALLFAPKPADPPALLALGPVPGQSTEAIANWFGGGNAHLRITVVGLIAAGQRGAALLSINGQPPQAFKVGQTLAQGVTLAAVLPEAIAIDQDGVVQNIAMPGQALPAQGFIPVGR
ncbi:hypothetical protein H0A71_16835 [Alcaligenaceae bacterium]|nr:hypothetical protein [Alcaligenaceae bacterium]